MTCLICKLEPPLAGNSSDITQRKMHIDLFMKITMKECIIYIKLNDVPIPNCSHCQECPDSDKFGHKGECLIVIKPLLLCTPFSKQPSPISFYTYISLEFNFVNPFTTNCLLARSQTSDCPSIISSQGR